jgi:hypothetical protein
VNDDLRLAQRHDERKPQCGHSVIGGRRAGATRDENKLIGSKSSKPLYPAKVTIPVAGLGGREPTSA